MFVCRFCDIRFFILKKYNAHLYLHRRISFPGFRCEFDGCKRLFKSYFKFKNHISRSHKPLTTVLIQNRLFQCSLKECKFSCTQYIDFKKHVYNHFHEFSEIMCPFSNECLTTTLFKS